MISPVRVIKDSRDKKTDLAPLQPAGSLMLSQAGRVGAAAAGSCRSCAQAGKCWCRFCSRCPAGVTAAAPERRWSPPQDESFPRPRTAGRPWPTDQPL